MKQAEMVKHTFRFSFNLLFALALWCFFYQKFVSGSCKIKSTMEGLAFDTPC